MMEWLQNIYNWIIENKDNIYTFFTSSTFVSSIVLLMSLLRSTKSTKKNTLSLDLFNSNVFNYTEMKKDVNSIRNEQSKINTELLNCNSKINKLQDLMDNFSKSMDVKINAILEVQNTVYSTLKDDNIRNTVNCILVSAKNSKDITKVKMQEELNELKVKLNEKLEDVKSLVDSTDVNTTNEIGHVNLTRY